MAETTTAARAATPQATTPGPADPTQASAAAAGTDFLPRVAVYRPSDHVWYIPTADGTRTEYSVTFGLPDDIPVPADYDGNGRTDVAVWRPSDGTWYVADRDGGLKTAVQWGTQGDIPVPADYDGDGRADFAVYRPNEGRFYVLQSSDGQTKTITWGLAGDRPLPAAYWEATTTARQGLERFQRAQAILTQVLRRWYDVPSGLAPDEGAFPRYAASFHKLFAHNAQTGQLTDDGVARYKQLLIGLGAATGPTSDFDDAALTDPGLLAPPPPSGRPRVLVQPRASKALSIKGPDVTAVRVSPLLYGAEDEARLLAEIGFGSDSTAAEMVEVYAQALLRQAQLGRYAGWPDADLAVNALNSFGRYFVWGYQFAGYSATSGTRQGGPPRFTAVNALGRPVTRDNLFRGPTGGDLAGDYRSVFLTFRRPPQFPAGCSSGVADEIGASAYADVLGQELRVPQGADEDFGATWAEHAALQNRRIPRPYRRPDDPRGPFFAGLGLLQTGRDLANYVHVDNLYEYTIRAADILNGGQYPRSPNSPYVAGGPKSAPLYPNEGDGATLGASDAYALLGGVREVAERAAFTQKWLVARRGRPEVLAALVHQALGGDEIWQRLSPRLLVTGGPVRALLDRVRAWNAGRNGGEQNSLLAQVFPEGSPGHPSWPSGHAVVVGAGVTVLKAIWDDTRPILDPDAKTPTPYLAPTGTPQAGEPLTVGGELDKLASNIAFGRDFAGVHFRSDGEHGIRLGEEIAVRYLQDHAREYRERFRACQGFIFTRRSGQRVCVTADGVGPAASSSFATTAAVAPVSSL